MSRLKVKTLKDFLSRSILTAFFDNLDIQPIENFCQVSIALFPTRVRLFSHTTSHHVHHNNKLLFRRPPSLVREPSSAAELVNLGLLHRRYARPSCQLGLKAPSSTQQMRFMETLVYWGKMIFSSCSASLGQQRSFWL